MQSRVCARQKRIPWQTRSLPLLSLFAFSLSVVSLTYTTAGITHLHVLLLATRHIKIPTCMYPNRRDAIFECVYYCRAYRLLYIHVLDDERYAGWRA